MQYPSLYLPLARRQRLAYDQSEKAVSDRTKIVIEGFPRSGNSFAYAAFGLAQPEPVAIAHHLHAPAQIVAATRRGIPCLVLIRSPLDAVVSFLIRADHLRPAQALQGYRRFYDSIWPYRERFVIADFDEVIGDFGLVVDKLNRFFGTDFTRFEHSDANVEECFRILDEINSKMRLANQDFEASVARPSQAREGHKELVREKLQDPSLDSLTVRCREIYAKYRGLNHAREKPATAGDR